MPTAIAPKTSGNQPSSPRTAVMISSEVAM